MDNFVAIFGVYQNTPNFEAQIANYGHIGFVIDDKAELEEGETLPEEWFVARGVNRESLIKVVAMRLPYDPFMHIWLQSWVSVSESPQWPPVYNQIGCRGMTLLVDNVDLEISRIRKSFPGATVLQESIPIRRKWGLTQTALMRDPDGNFVELMSIEGQPHARRAQSVPNHGIGFLHFMLNCTNYDEMLSFYQAFGMEHDHGVDFREDGWPDGLDYFQNQYKEAFGSMPLFGRCGFLRGKRDPSHMHLEVLEAKEDLKLPNSRPTWAQRGIARYCLKVPDFDRALEGAKQRKNHLYIERQKGALNWGDSIWAFVGDSDGHIVTLEQWMPHRYFGARS